MTVMILPTQTTISMSRVNTLFVRSSWFLPINWPQRIVAPPTSTALIMLVSVTIGLNRPVAVSASAPIRLLAMAPSMMLFRLPIATRMICTGSSLKNILVMILESFFTTHSPVYSIVKISVKPVTSKTSKI